MFGMVKLNSFFISNNNILLLIFTSSLVIVLDKVKFTNCLANYFAASTLAIYLLTDNGFVRKPLDTWLLKEMLNGVQGYVYILIVVVVCLFIDKVRELIFDFVKVLLSKVHVKSIFR